MLIFLVAKLFEWHGATIFKHGGHGTTNRPDSKRVGALEVKQ
jgi:hypothetical protein